MLAANRAACLRVRAAETLDRPKRDRGQYAADRIADANTARRWIFDPVIEPVPQHFQAECDGFPLHVAEAREFRALAVADACRSMGNAEEIQAQIETPPSRKSSY